REGRELRRIQLEVASLMVENKRIGEEIRDLQQEMHVDQRHARSALVETQQTVERVAQISAPRKRRRLPRIRVQLVSEPECPRIESSSIPATGFSWKTTSLTTRALPESIKTVRKCHSRGTAF